jgi:hypothetical protein
VGPWREAGASSFHSVVIASRPATCSVLFHAHVPIVAFAGALPLPGELIRDFMECPYGAETFEAGGLQLLGPYELGLPMAEADLACLSPAELAQVSYWRPEVLSDLLFNWWD